MVAAVHKVVEQVSAPQRAHTILMQQGYKPDFDQQNPTHTITICIVGTANDIMMLIWTLHI